MSAGGVTWKADIWSNCDCNNWKVKVTQTTFHIPGMAVLYSSCCRGKIKKNDSKKVSGSSVTFFFPQVKVSRHDWVGSAFLLQGTASGQGRRTHEQDKDAWKHLSKCVYWSAEWCIRRQPTAGDWCRETARWRDATKKNRHFLKWVSSQRFPPHPNAATWLDRSIDRLTEPQPARPVRLSGTYSTVCRLHRVQSGIYCSYTSYGYKLYLASLQKLPGLLTEAKSAPSSARTSCFLYF